MAGIVSAWTRYVYVFTMMMICDYDQKVRYAKISY
jgi:hypothetical protein